LSVFAELAVDFAGRELSPVEKNLRLDSDGIDLVLGWGLGSKFRIIDGRRIKPGSKRRKREPARKNSRDKQAFHPPTLRFGKTNSPTTINIGLVSSGALSRRLETMLAG
jgi:hypothetical protein